MYNKSSSGTITVKYIGKPNYLKVFGKSKKKKKLKNFAINQLRLPRHARHEVD